MFNQTQIKHPFLYKTSHFTRIVVPIADYQNLLQIYDWRSQTDYPIISCHWNKIILNPTPTNLYQPFIQNNNLQQTKFLYIEVTVEPVVLLQKYETLNFHNFIYALKQTLVGFERLLTIFGSFQINSKMIAVNQEGKVKVWMAEMYSHNVKMCIGQNKLQIRAEHYMVNKIKYIFRQFASQNHIFRDFFKKVDLITTFLQFLKYIQEFCAEKKLAVSNRIFQKVQPSQQRSLSPRFKLKPAKRTPKFIGGIQQKFSKNNLLKRKVLSSQRYQQNGEQSINVSLATKQTLLEWQNQKCNPIRSKSKQMSFFKIKSLTNSILFQEKNIQVEITNFQQTIKRLLQPDPKTMPKHINNSQPSLMKLGRRVKDSYII